MIKNIQDTSRESYLEVVRTLGERQMICLDALEKLKEATANEIAKYLHEQGITPYFDRNFVHPRLNELVNKQLIIITGKKFDTITNRKCMTYKLKLN